MYWIFFFINNLLNVWSVINQLKMNHYEVLFKALLITYKNRNKFKHSFKNNIWWNTIMKFTIKTIIKLKKKTIIISRKKKNQTPNKLNHSQFPTTHLMAAISSTATNPRGTKTALLRILSSQFRREIEVLIKINARYRRASSRSNDHLCPNLWIACLKRENTTRSPVRVRMHTCTMHCALWVCVRSKVWSFRPRGNHCLRFSVA